MKIAILGYGLEGQAAHDYWREGNEITICDQNPDLVVPDGIQKSLGENYLANLDGFDVIVRSPFVKPKDIASNNSPEILEKVTSNTNEFFRVCPTKNIIGVTGTKGKGTTSTLITKLLESTGKHVHLGGNIGIPALSLLNENIQSDDWVVLELSSYQLSDLRYSPHLAACLLVEPEHLDWHEDLQDYIDAKSNLFRQQTDQDIAVYFADNQRSTEIASTSKGQKIPYFAQPGALVQDGTVMIDGQAICRTDELKLLGEHNWQNVCAALTVVWQASQDAEAFRSVLTSFAGLPFRIELRTERHGIKYYNDSFASNPPATMAAIKAIPEPKIVIVGGFDRNLPLEQYAEFLKLNELSIKKLLVIGASGDRLVSALDAANFKKYQRSTATTMPGIVAEATSLATPGDAVVLSPGFASYDMFNNFEDRGRQFNDAVDAL